jgi:hypothetical protein
MFGRLIAGGIRGGDAVHLLGGVPENVVVLALVRVLHAAFGSHECPPYNPVGETGVPCDSPVTTVGPRMRSQLVPTVPSLPRWASPNWFRPELV